jgi:hypothetical protein
MLKPLAAHTLHFGLGQSVSEALKPASRTCLSRLSLRTDSAVFLCIETSPIISGSLALPVPCKAKFATLLDRFANDVRVVTPPCPGLVELIKQGCTPVAASQGGLIEARSLCRWAAAALEPEVDRLTRTLVFLGHQERGGLF